MLLQNRAQVGYHEHVWRRKRETCIHARSSLCLIISRTPPRSHMDKKSVPCVVRIKITLPLMPLIPAQTWTCYDGFLGDAVNAYFPNLFTSLFRIRETERDKKNKHRATRPLTSRRGGKQSSSAHLDSAPHRAPSISRIGNK